MSNVPVSLIVPVYNSEKTLPALFACIDEQVLETFEVIFVDDGSTDCSLELLQEYATSRQNVIIVTQKHSGPGAARNAGLRIAQGAYIAFADADDTFTPEFLYAPYLHALATSSDFVFFDFERVAPDCRELVCHSGLLTTDVSVGGTVSWRNTSNIFEDIFPNVWNKLWNRSFIESNRLRFFNLISAEDRIFTTEAILAANRVSHLPMSLYNHNQIGDLKITATMGVQNLLASMTAWEHILALLSSDRKYRPLCVSAVRALVRNQLWYNREYKGDWKDPEIYAYIKRLHKLLNSEYFFGIEPEDFVYAKHKAFFHVLRHGNPTIVGEALANGGLNNLLSLANSNIERFFGRPDKVIAEVSGVTNVSVIVPVFNAEEYLPQLFACLDAQLCESFEVIFIDDGSTDSSLKLLEEYASSHANVAVITQTNRGAGAARNVGLERARGEYIVFVDADDAFIPTFLNTVYEKAARENADILAFGHVDVFDGRERTFYPQVSNMPKYKERTVFSWIDDPERVLTMCGFHATWNRAYRRSFLLEKALRFPEVSVSNDWPFSVLAFLQARRIAWLRETPYTYIRRLDNTSITAKKKAGYKIAALQACEFALQSAQKLPYYEHIRSALIAFVAHEIYRAVAFYDWASGANGEMRELLTRVPITCRNYGITDEDIRGVLHKNACPGGLLKVLCEDSSSVEDIERALTVPFVLALRAKHLEDVVPVVEAEALKRGKLDFQLSGIDVFLSHSGAREDSSTSEFLANFIETGWLRIHYLSEDADSAWILEAIKNNPHTHLVCGNLDRVVDARLDIGSLAVAMLNHPGAVIAWCTRTNRLRDGSIIEPEYWLETETAFDGALVNLWVDTRGYYLIPYGVLDVEKASDLLDVMPESVRSDEEYVVNALLQECAIPVASARHPLPEVAAIGGSVGIKNIDSDVLEWIEANRAFNRWC